MSDLTAEQWNGRYPPGTPVTAYPGLRPEHPAFAEFRSKRLETRTRSAAWNLGHGEPVVLVNDYAGGISLEHIDLRTEEAPMSQPQPATCATCHTAIHWIDCPTGGWWRHDQHPSDDHDAEPDHIREALDEMHTAVEFVIQKFIDRCPEGFKAVDVADAIVEVCSDELTDLYDARAQRDNLAEQAEALRIRLWLIERALAPIDIRQDPTGIVPTVGPYLDGPIHPGWIAAYHAAQKA